MRIDFTKIALLISMKNIRSVRIIERITKAVNYENIGALLKE